MTAATGRLPFPESKTGLPKPTVLLSIWATLFTLVIAGELLPGNSAPMTALSDSGVSDIAMHFAAYSLLGFVPALGLRVRTVVLCLFLGQVVGVALEFGQAFVPGRSCDLNDAIANGVGLLAGTLCAGLIRARLTKVQRLRRRGGRG